MTHLRQLMLEELHRRNYAESTSGLTFVRYNISAATSAVHPISLALSIFGSIRPRCSLTGNCNRTPSRNDWRPCVFSMSRY